MLQHRERLPLSHQVRVHGMDRERAKLPRQIIPYEKLAACYRPFVAKRILFDTTRASQVFGLHPFVPREVSGLAMKKGEFLMGGDLASWASGSVVDGKMRGGNMPPDWSDPPIACGLLEVDGRTAVTKRWGELKGEVDVDEAPGWVGYLECARDEMQTRGFKGTWQSYVD